MRDAVSRSDDAEQRAIREESGDDDDHRWPEHREASLERPPGSSTKRGPTLPPARAHCPLSLSRRSRMVSATCFASKASSFVRMMTVAWRPGTRTKALRLPPGTANALNRLDPRYASESQPAPWSTGWLSPLLAPGVASRVNVRGFSRPSASRYSSSTSECT